LEAPHKADMEGAGMGSKGLQMVAYIVLAAIMLASGFGALGPAALAGLG
jgi:hypothetical protein